MESTFVERGGFMDRGHKAGGGQDGGHRADPVDEVHGVRVRCWGAGLVSAGLPCCLL